MTSKSHRRWKLAGYAIVTAMAKPSIPGTRRANEYMALAPMQQYCMNHPPIYNRSGDNHSAYAPLTDLYRTNFFPELKNYITESSTSSNHKELRGKWDNTFVNDIQG